VPLALLMTALPLAPGGIGTGHAAFYFFFLELGSEAGADLFTMFLAAQLLIALVGGLICVQLHLCSDNRRHSS
jgi:glycosyltransferase 2 family protein